VLQVKTVIELYKLEDNKVVLKEGGAGNATAPSIAKNQEITTRNNYLSFYLEQDNLQNDLGLTLAQRCERLNLE